MNRRTSLKSIASLFLIGVSSASVYEWIHYNGKINFNLLAKKKLLIAELAETIIPRTDTPGAKDAKVEDYILRMLEFCTSRKEQHVFLDGLNDLEAYALKYYNSGFVNCADTNKYAILRHYEDKSNYTQPILNKIDKKLFGMPFFTKLKELTIQGYCTSKPGATKGLAYDFIPSTYQACVPLANHQRSWATK